MRARAGAFGGGARGRGAGLVVGFLSASRGCLVVVGSARVQRLASNLLTLTHLLIPSVITFNREDAKGQHVTKDTFKEKSRFKAVLLAAKAANVPVSA